jgi:hypothetical protein
VWMHGTAPLQRSFLTNWAHCYPIMVCNHLVYSTGSGPCIGNTWCTGLCHDITSGMKAKF